MDPTFRSFSNGMSTVKKSLCPENPPLGERVRGHDEIVQKSVRPWVELLRRTIEAEVLPRLLAAQREADLLNRAEQQASQQASSQASHVNAADVAAFVNLIVADDMEQVRAVADRVIVIGGGRDVLLTELLTPAAQLLGRMWERDVCDFTTVTLGVFRLDQIMKETAAVGIEDIMRVAFDHRILLVPSPGEQHNFGLNVVVDTFREGGWMVRSGSALSRKKIMNFVKDEWFDVIGISVMADRALEGLPACIRAVRQASCNPHLFVLIGGRAIMNHTERTRFLGADATALDAHQALEEANILVKSKVTERLQQSKTKLVDIG
ncbi:MAG: cobalamin-dependent protein [Acidocella sp.]|nr:cobalamin-dependent protein [Acidocella sp.]